MHASPETSDLREPSDAPRGIVELICGCMFSGKTTRLLELLRVEAPERVLVVKHNKDRRYSDGQIVTHDGQGRSAVLAARADEIIEHVNDETEVVAIDEGHFYDDRLPAVCRDLAADGKRVLITSLDLDMWGMPFGNIEALKEIAAVVRVQRAVCAACGQPATRTHRKTPIVDCNLVGGSADFEPRCEACWSPPPEAHIDSAEMA
jgi:thymidine kinase